MKSWLAPACAMVGAAVGATSTVHLYGWANVHFWIGDVFTGGMLLACGAGVVLMVRHDGIGWLLIIAGWAWFLPALAAAASVRSAVVLGALLVLHRAVLAHAFLTYPTGRASGAMVRAGIAAAYVVSIVPGVWSSPPLVVVMCVVVIGLQGTMMVHSRPLTDHLLGTVMACVFWCVVAGLSLFRSVGQPAGAMLDGYQVTVGVLALVLALGVVGESRRRLGVPDLVVELGGDRHDGLEGRLAIALDDPLLQVGYWVSSAARYVDWRGNALDVDVASKDGGRVATVVRGTDAEPVAVLVHDRRLLAEPVLNGALTLAASLSAEQARLQVALRNSLVETEASRRRLVGAADEERDRLESRLRAGAGATLTKLAGALDSALGSAASEDTRSRIWVSAEQLARTSVELTRLARGVSPRRVVERGLDDALAELARDCEVAVRLDLEAMEAPLEVRVCLYFVCSEAFANVVKHAPDATISVGLVAREGNVLLTVDDDGPGGANVAGGSGLRGLADRVETLGGTLTVISQERAGTHLTATIPLGIPAAG